MAKEQQFMELFPKYDADKDGQIDSTQLLGLLGELGVANLYPGSISNMIRKLNYTNPEKTTVSLQQAKQYFLSFQSACKHDIWKGKYNFYSMAADIKRDMSDDNTDSAAPAAPGAATQKEQPVDKGNQATINILIGQDKPIYTSQIEIEIEKKQKNDIPKPFIKLIFTSKTVERAKALEILFKQNFTSFLVLLGHDISDWNDELQKMFHINSLVNDTTTTFFITTTNEDIVEYIKLFASMFELSFNYELIGKAHAKFEFDYDFEKFYTDNLSNFYDIFVKDCKISLNATIINGIKAIRNYLIKSKVGGFFHHEADTILILSFLHLQEVDADLEFDNIDLNGQYQLQSKNELIQFIREIGKFFGELEQGGMKVYQLLELLDESISIEAIAGEWKVKIFLILKNMNKLLLNLAKKPEEEEEAVPVPKKKVHSSNSQLSEESQKNGITLNTQFIEKEQKQTDELKKSSSKKKIRKPSVELARSRSRSRNSNESQDAE